MDNQTEKLMLSGFGELVLTSEQKQKLRDAFEQKEAFEQKLRNAIRLDSWISGFSGGSAAGLLFTEHYILGSVAVFACLAMLPYRNG